MHRVHTRLKKAKLALDTMLFNDADERNVFADTLSPHQLQSGGRKEERGQSEEEPISNTVDTYPKQEKNINCVGDLSIKPPSSTSENSTSGSSMARLIKDAYTACPLCDRAFADSVVSPVVDATSLFDDEYPAVNDGGASDHNAAPVVNLLPGYVYMTL